MDLWYQSHTQEHWVRIYMEVEYAKTMKCSYKDIEKEYSYHREMRIWYKTLLTNENSLPDTRMNEIFKKLYKKEYEDHTEKWIYYLRLLN